MPAPFDLRASNPDEPLDEANLRGADLRGADLSWANLRGADLSWANLSGAIVYLDNRRVVAA